MNKQLKQELIETLNIAAKQAMRIHDGCKYQQERDHFFNRAQKMENLIAKVKAIEVTDDH